MKSEAKFNRIFGILELVFSIGCTIFIFGMLVYTQGYHSAMWMGENVVRVPIENWEGILRLNYMLVGFSVLLGVGIRDGVHRVWGR